MGELRVDELAQRFLEASPDLCYAVDDEGQLVWWNDAVVSTSGYDEETLAGFDAMRLVAPDQRADARDAFEHAELLPDDVTLTFDLLTADGERIPYDFNGTETEVGGETVFVTVGRDVSSRNERERDIRRRRDEFDRLNRISESVYEAIQAVTDAATREGIEEVTAERLADCGFYRAVAVERREGERVVDARRVGEAAEFAEIAAAVDDPEWRRPAVRAAESGETAVARALPAADTAAVARAAERFDVRAGVAVPVGSRERLEGVLGVYSSRPDAFDDREREALRRLGSVIGFAIHAVQAERLVSAGTAVELTFRTTAPDGLLASVSEHADGRCYREWSVPTESGGYRHYVTVEGLTPARVVDVLEDRPTVESVGHVGGGDPDDVFEVVTNDSLVRRLLEVGAATVEAVAEDGESTIVAELPGGVDARSVADAVGEMYDVELASKRTLDRPVRTVDELHDPVADRLTDRQRAALRHAYHNGYFSWPRGATAEEIAEIMDISSPTLHYHLRQAEQTLVEAYLQYVE